MKIIKDEYIIPNTGMVSASYEVGQRTYDKTIDAQGNVWLVPFNDPNPSANIHVDNPNDTNSQGYGGSILRFALTDGTKYKAKGPWHTNANALFKATKIDVRNTVLTQVVIGLHHGDSHSCVKDVIHFEEEPQAGLFERGDILAQQLANDLKRPVFAYRCSAGGSCTGFVYPKDWTIIQQTEWHD